MPTQIVPIQSGSKLLATGSCSGATVTISGIGGYDYYNVVFSGIRTGSASTNPSYYLRINGDSSSNYLYVGHTNYTASSQVGITTGDGYINLTPGMGAYRQNSSNLFNLQFDNCNSGGFIKYVWTGSYRDDSNTAQAGSTGSGIFKVASNLSSLVLSMTSPATYDQGTYYIYGGRN